MKRALVAMNEGRRVTTPISSTRPSGPLDGVDITSWRDNGVFSTPLAAMFISGSTAMTIDSPPGGARGVELYGYRLDQWWLIGYINDGAPIEIGGQKLGYAQQVNVLGIFTRLAVVGLPSTGTANATFAPVDQWDGP